MAENDSDPQYVEIGWMSSRSPQADSAENGSSNGGLRRRLVFNAMYLGTWTGWKWSYSMLSLLEGNSDGYGYLTFQFGHTGQCRTCGLV